MNISIYTDRYVQINACTTILYTYRGRRTGRSPHESTIQTGRYWAAVLKRSLDVPTFSAGTLPGSLRKYKENLCFMLFSSAFCLAFFFLPLAY